MSREVVLVRGVRTTVGDHGSGGRYALVTMCNRGGQGIAAVSEQM